MSTTTARIDLPQFERESSAAYDCRVRYLMLGPERTVAKVAEQTGKSRRQLERWCTEHRWRESARRYDETSAQLALEADMRQYAADLRAMQLDSRKMGEALTTVAMEMLVRIAKSLDSMELNASSLSHAVNAMIRGMEMRSHSLSVDQLLARYKNENLSYNEFVGRITVDLDQELA